MSVKSPSDPQLAAKRSVYFNVLSRWLTNKVIIRHSWLTRSHGPHGSFGEKKGNYSPFFLIKGGKECMYACPYPCNPLGVPHDFAFKGANHISSIIQGNLGKPHHTFDMDFPPWLPLYWRRVRVPIIQAAGVGKISCCALTQWGKPDTLSQDSPTASTPWLATLGRTNRKQRSRNDQTNTNTASEHPISTRPGHCLFIFFRGTLFSGGGTLSFATQDCTLLKMPSPPLFFFFGRGEGWRITKGHSDWLRHRLGTAEP